MMELFTLIDPGRVLKLMETLIQTPSVVGYYPEIHNQLERLVSPWGYRVEYDNRHTAYIRVAGRDSSRTVCLGAHLDTIGMVVRHIDEKGWLDIRNLGGLNFHSLEGENVYVHTREHGTFTGTLICKSHSVHVFEDARERKRDFTEMAVVLDEDVHTPEEVCQLGVLPGDLISVEPKLVFTKSGFVKSRHIDDKACAACLLEVLAILAQKGLQPVFDTWFAFPIYEEIGLGGAYVPDVVDEYLALDIGLVGGLQHGDEKKVSIAGADRIAPYDWDLTTELMNLARRYDIQYAMDIYYRYGSDATAALKGGQNLLPASIGMGTLSSHGYERTHIEGILNTTALTLSYVLDRSMRKEVR